VDRGEAHDFIILPGEKVTVVSVNPKCPTDRLVETLSEEQSSLGSQAE